MLDRLKRLSQSLQKGLPEYTLEGIDRIYWDEEIEVERSLCFYFGKWEEFHERQMQRAFKMEVPPLQERLKEWKAEKNDDFTTASGMLVSYVLADRVPEDPEVRKEIDHNFGYLLEDMPPTEEFVLQHFTEQQSLLNLGSQSILLRRYKERMPDQTLSTAFAYHRINPQMHLIAADISGQRFANDGVFFERANFRAADLRGCVFEETTSIKGAFLEGTDLRGAKGLTNEILAECYIDARTKIPGNVDRKKIEKLHAAMDMPPAPPFTDFEAKHMPNVKVKPASPVQESFDKANAAQPAPPKEDAVSEEEREHQRAMEKYRKLLSWQI